MTTPVIDIHIIPAPGNEASYARQLERLKHPLVNVQIAEYVTGNMIEARWRGFSIGSAPYVSWVDDDDEIVDLSWLERAVRLLDDQTIAAVYPRWRGTMNGKLLHETSGLPFSPTRFLQAPALIDPHHLTIMRRVNVISMLSDVRSRFPVMMKNQERLLTIGQLRYGRLVALKEMAYEWKVREGSARTWKEDPDVEAWTMQHIRDSLKY
jgi:hypothetical protein